MIKIQIPKKAITRQAPRGHLESVPKAGAQQQCGQQQRDQSQILNSMRASSFVDYVTVARRDLQPQVSFS